MLGGLMTAYASDQALDVLRRVLRTQPTAIQTIISTCQRRVVGAESADRSAPSTASTPPAATPRIISAR